MSDLDTFRIETRAWLEANCPPEMRQPVLTVDDRCWGGRTPTFQSPAQKLWLDRMAEHIATSLAIESTDFETGWFGQHGWDVGGVLHPHRLGHRVLVGRHVWYVAILDLAFPGDGSDCGFQQLLSLHEKAGEGWLEQPGH